ncbi:MAG: preprotein translocase subunit SecA [Gammaproteobacteria bacterium]|nr:preprotein translocase subunit SecA [Gammaproteobacteria bacterium]
MPSSIPLLRPSLITGEYPERQDRLLPWPEILLAKLTRRVAKYRVARPVQLRKMLAQVEQQGADVKNWSEAELTAQLAQLRQRMQAEGLTEELVFRSFAIVRETASRILGKRHYDVQVIGGWLMINGMLAEMDTGEGKTLTASLPACTAAFAGIPVHVITANDYLVERDAREMGALYNALGLSVGAVIEGMDQDARRKAYACDITYCTNKQVAFDYLRDRLTMGRHASRRQLEVERLHSDNARIDRLLLRGLCFAIVDEADSVLIDEARTPLVISQTSTNRLEEQTYQQALDIARQLQEGVDFTIQQQPRSILLTEQGKTRLASLCQPLKGVWTGQRRREYLLKQALSALHLFVRDKHYLCKDGKVQIIDENTGRVMADRSWELGLHQLIETKEGLALSSSKETLARISYQRFFRRYLRLAGMSGTAREVAAELGTVYGLQVARVPPHRPPQKSTHPDWVYGTVERKWAEVIKRIKEIHNSGRPILVGTKSLADSEYLSTLLSKARLPHRVLNAKQDAREAEIIAQAGQPGRITVATNMAGRGTDIRLGSGVAGRGGLHVIATERHEAHRIDRQLFGRCGRQGDPGSFEAIVSLQDELVQVYLPVGLQRLLKIDNDGKDSRIGKWSRRLIKLAQHRAQRQHKQIRRDLLKADEVLANTLAFTGRTE